MRSRFWVKLALQNTMIIIGGSAVYGLVTAVTGHELEGVGVLRSVSLFLLLFGAGMNAVLDVNLYKLYLPLSLSFGSTRKEAVVGIESYRLISMGMLLGASLGLAALAGEDAIGPVWFIAPIAVMLLLVTDALGTILGVVTARYGRTAVIWTSVLMGLLLALCVAGVVLLFVTLSRQGKALPGQVLWLLVAVGLMLHGASLVPVRKTVYGYNVKL